VHTICHTDMSSSCSSGLLRHGLERSSCCGGCLTTNFVTSHAAPSTVRHSIGAWHQMVELVCIAWRVREALLGGTKPCKSSTSCVDEDIRVCWQLPQQSIEALPYRTFSCECL
jgi:hypothetical protein